MNISGVLVHARPERATAVTDALRALPGVEVHDATNDGQLVVTIEDTDAATSGDTMLKINLLDGVLSASLVYHHFEPEAPPSAPGAMSTS